MKRDRVALALFFAALAWPVPAWAENVMEQSPLLMRRAGPSCRPGDLDGSQNAGYGLALGPCVGAEPTTPPVENERVGRSGRKHPGRVTGGVP